MCCRLESAVPVVRDSRRGYEWGLKWKGPGLVASGLIAGSPPAVMVSARVSRNMRFSEEEGRRAHDVPTVVKGPPAAASSRAPPGVGASS